MQEWLPEPPKGTPICLGADGSDFDDWTAIRAETIDGLQFTPRYGPDRLPTFWDPKTWPGARTPREQVQQAVDELFSWYEVERLYFDPPRFETDIDALATRHPGHVFEWWTNRPKQMHAALERFSADLDAGRITQDGCPVTAIHMANARRIPRGILYLLEKPSKGQKIDLVMASVLAHEAAADARADGWGEKKSKSVIHFRR